MTLNSLLRLTAVFEAATGAALLIRPSAVIVWLLAVTPSVIAAALGRVTGIALIALAIACWPRRGVESDATSARAMFIYSLLVGLYLAYLGVAQSAGALLWPAVGAHLLLVVFFVAARSRDRHRTVE